MNILRWTLAAATATLFLAGPEAAPAQSPPPCEDTPAFHALDFWVGEWTVHVQDQQVGTNRIVKVLDGCAIEEHWTGGRGGRGQSLFYYVPGLEEWRQVWVTDRATATGAVKEKRLVEGFEGAGVRFQGEIPLPEGGSYLDRTTLTPLPGGRVRQVIEISPDGGASWRTTFDAEYRPTTGARGPGPAPAAGILERMNSYTEFVSRTFLRPGPDDEWRQIAEDRWTRAEPRGPEEPRPPRGRW